MTLTAADKPNDILRSATLSRTWDDITRLPSAARGLARMRDAIDSIKARAKGINNPTFVADLKIAEDAYFAAWSKYQDINDRIEAASIVAVTRGMLTRDQVDRGMRFVTPGLSGSSPSGFWEFFDRNVLSVVSALFLIGAGVAVVVSAPVLATILAAGAVVAAVGFVADRLIPETANLQALQASATEAIVKVASRVPLDPSKPAGPDNPIQRAPIEVLADAASTAGTAAAKASIGPVLITGGIVAAIYLLTRRPTRTGARRRKPRSAA